MNAYFCPALLLCGGTGVGMYYLHEGDYIFRVNHALRDFGFTIYPKEILSDDCKRWLGYSFYSVDQKSFVNAREKCVRPVRFSELANSQDLIPLDPFSSEKSTATNSSQPDWMWASSIFDYTTNRISEEVKNYLNIKDTSNNAEGGGQTEIEAKKNEIKTKLSSQLEAFSDETKKNEFISNLAQLLTIVEWIDDVKMACWALQFTVHNATSEKDPEFSEFKKDWEFYVKYCTKYKVQ